MSKKIIGVVVGLGLFGGLGLLAHTLTDNVAVIGYNQGYEPDQPIAYSHAKHAGELQIDCQYCHTSTARSRHASVPSLNICMNCHSLVKLDSPELKKLKDSYFENKPVEWQKVHLLPDHVRFNHAAHIRAGKECTQCHGQVESMEKVKQVESLSMGWCVNCHRQPENNASVTCGTCHY